MEKNSYARTLYSDPSFLQGAAKVLDLAGTYDRYNTAESAEEADRMAILSDWYATGADLASSIKSYREEKQDRVPK